MRPEGILKHFFAALAIAVIFYFVCFSWIEHRREAKGPWEITFQSDATGVPDLQISEVKLDISQSVRFPHEKTTPNLSRTISFAEETRDLPFGEFVFQDPTFLPGTLTMRLFGHEIELLPRVLTIDKKEYSWQSTNRIDVQ